MDQTVVKKILQTSLLISLIVIAGSIGYYFVEGYNVVDALYMTVITLTTTGFQEVQPLSQNGRIFTIILLLFGMSLVTYCLTTIASFIASLDFSRHRRERMEKKISEFSGHTIVCGYGRMGEIICKKLESEGVEFVVIEKDLSLINQLKNSNYNYLEGDAAHDETLIRAAVSKAKVLVSVIDSDADGLYITLAGRSFNKDLNIIVRANEQSASQRMVRAGANKVVLPFVMSGLKVAESVINPAAEDIFNIPDATGSSTDYMQVGDLYITKKSLIIGKKLADIGDSLEGLIIVGVRKRDQSFIFKPRGSYVFELDDCLITMGEASAHRETIENYKLDYVPPYKVEEAS